MFSRIRQVLGGSGKAGGHGGLPTVTMARAILVPQSAIDALPDTPDVLMQAVVDYTNALINSGRYLRGEINPALLQAYHVDFWLAQVNNGGISQFIHNCGGARDIILSDVVAGMQAMGSDNHAFLAMATQKWVRDNPQEADAQTGFDGGIAGKLRSLTQTFFDLSKRAPLRLRIAAWMAKHPDLRVVPDAALSAEVQKMLEANPDRGRRTAIAQLARIEGEMLDPLRLGVSIATGRPNPPELIRNLGAGSYMDIDGTKQMAFRVNGLSGPRLAVPGDGGGLSLYDLIVHDNPGMPSDPLKATLEEMRAYRAPEAGALLTRVPQERITEVARILKGLQAPAALHAALTRFPKIEDLLPVSVLHCGPYKDKGDQALLAFADRSGVYAIWISEGGAVLNELGKTEALVKVNRAEIEAHARFYDVSTLI